MLTVSIWFMVLHILVGVVLLTDINFQIAWRTTETISLSSAGLIQSDLSLIANSNDTSERFWYFYSGILSNTMYQMSVDPISCSGDGCYSFFFPGGVNTINTTTSIPLDVSNEASAFLAIGVPGYQVEFYPPANPPQFDPAVDCVINNKTLAICLKKEGNDIIAGNNLKY